MTIYGRGLTYRSWPQGIFRDASYDVNYDVYESAKGSFGRAKLYYPFESYGSDAARAVGKIVSGLSLVASLLIFFGVVYMRRR